MAKETEQSLPQLGFVIPSKELSLTENYRYSGISPLEYYIKHHVSDWPGVFAAVYHHTILHSDWRPHSAPKKGETRYQSKTPFPDQYALLTLLAQNTTSAELYTAVLVSPQMQTALLAQQVAAIANLSKGRLRLGLGLGWNKSEYEALGMGDRFGKRGKILNEQIPALKKLLKGEPYTGQIDKERFDHMAINPGTQYEVPIWIGGQSEAARKRAAQFGDGWMPLGDLDQFQEQVKLLWNYLDEFGKDPAQFKTMGRIALGKTPSEKWVDEYIGWHKAGATHVALTTTGNEDEFDPEGEKADPYHHLGLKLKFFKAIDWLRHASGGFSRIFGSENLMQNLELPGELKDMRYFELNPNLKIDHLGSFLTTRGEFEWKNIDALRVKIKGTGEGLVSMPVGLIGPENNRVIFLEPENYPDKVYVVYDREIELGFGLWR